MTQDKGIPYQRHKPSAALREFLDPLDPGSYFDCGRARLHGLDDALLKEAESRGRNVGDDSFQLVATDMGLVFCRPSISFAIAARWEEVQLIRPHGEDPVILPVTWPTHGELKFTVSKRLAGNIFRRWLQLRMQAARLTRDRREDAQAQAGAKPEIDQPVDHVEPYAPVSAEVAVTSGAGAEASDVQQSTDESTEQDLGEWEVVSKVEPPPAPEPKESAEPTVVERRDTGVSVKRRKLDERGAERRRVDRPLVLSAFDAETSLPISDPAAKVEVELEAEAEAEVEAEVEVEVEVAADADIDLNAEAERLDLDLNADVDLDAEQVSDTMEGPPVVDAIAPVERSVFDEPVGEVSASELAPGDLIIDELVADEPAAAEPVSAGPDAAEPVTDEVIDEPSDQPEDEHAWPVHPKTSPAQPAENQVAASVVSPATAVDPEAKAEPAKVNAEAATETEPDRETGNKDTAAKKVTAAKKDTADKKAAVDKKVAVVAETDRAAAEVERPPVERKSDLYGAGVRSIAKPETTPTSWVGSPLSLVATVVAVSTGVLMLTLAVSVYRSGSGSGLESASVDAPVGRTTINHQRFKPDGASSEPLRSAALTPTGTDGANTTTTVADPLSPARADEVSGNQPRLCNSNYSGCVADVSDVDCPGDGDGPVFSEGPAVVMGEDVYQLDTDGDGETCEPDQPRLEDEGAGEESTTAELEPAIP